MATEYISYKEVVMLKKNKRYISAFKYSYYYYYYPIIEIGTPLYNNNFSILNDSHHFFNNNKTNKIKL